MKLLASLFFITLPVLVSAQTYSTKSQGSNNSAGGAYVSPVVTKVYNMNSPGYQSPQKSSFNSYKSNSTASASNISVTNRNNNTDNIKSKGLRIKPGIYMTDDGKWGVTDMEGYKASPAIYDFMFEWSRISRGIATVMVNLNGKWGVLWAPDGVPVVPIEYDDLIDIDRVTVLARKGSKVGIIKFGGPNTLKTLIPVEQDDIGKLGSSYWVKSGDQYGLFSFNYERILATEYDEISIFSDSYYLVKKGNKMGIYAYNGTPVLPLVYESISTVSQNAAWVLQGNKWGLVNYKGKFLATPQYDSVYVQPGGMTWVNNMAVVSKAGKRIYLNDDGLELDPGSVMPGSPKKMMSEDFSEGAEKNKWPAHPNARCTDGVYEVTIAPNGEEDDIEIPFPADIAYSETDDWSLEMSIDDVKDNGKKIYGITMKNKSAGTDVTYCTFSTNYVTLTGINNGHRIEKLGKTKKGFNRIKLVKKGTQLQVYYNKDQVITGTINEGRIMAGKFYLLVSKPVQAADNVVAFDDIRFEILPAQ